MQSRIFFIVGAIAIFFSLFSPLSVQANPSTHSLIQRDTLTEDTRIDSIIIDRNWRTRDKIILRELTFQPGDVVTPQMMKESIDRVWNVGNFATVDWTLDQTTVPGMNIMRLTARDAFTIIPLFAFNGSDQDFTLDVGIIDGNLFGRNIRGRFGYRFATFERKWDIGFGLPRQLLYRNMTLDFNVKQGTQTNFLFENRKRDQGIAYDVLDASVSIGNPWHEDYRYTFSPNLNIAYRAHDVYNTRLDSGVVPLAEQEYRARFLRFRIDENIGLVNRKRHQEDRWAVNFAYGLGVGLNDESPMYHAVVISGEAHKLFNPIVQLSVEGRAGYTSNALPSGWFYRGAGDVRSITTGEIGGKAYYTMKVGGFFTYINRNWFAMEQSMFFHFGQGSQTIGGLFQEAPLFAVGTGVRLMTPMVPWFYFQFDVAYSGPNSNWYFIQW